MAANGSIQGLAEVSDALKQRYKTVWEIKLCMEAGSKDGHLLSADEAGYVVPRDFPSPDNRYIHPYILFYPTKNGGVYEIICDVYETHRV